MALPSVSLDNRVAGIFFNVALYVSCRIPPVLNNIEMFLRRCVLLYWNNCANNRLTYIQNHPIFRIHINQIHDCKNKKNEHTAYWKYPTSISTTCQILFYLLPILCLQFIPMLFYDILSMYNEFHNHMWRSILYLYIIYIRMDVYIHWLICWYMKAIPLPLTWSSLDSKEPTLPYQCPHSSETKNKNKKVSVLIWFELG